MIVNDCNGTANGTCAALHLVSFLPGAQTALVSRRGAMHEPHRSFLLQNLAQRRFQYLPIIVLGKICDEAIMFGALEAGDVIQT